MGTYHCDSEVLMHKIPMSKTKSVGCPNFTEYGVFHKEELYLVGENSVYSLWLGVRPGDDEQKAIYALGYIPAVGNPHGRNRDENWKIIVTRQELEGLTNFVKQRNKHHVSRFNHNSTPIDIGVVDDIYQIPVNEDKPCRIWIIESDRQELGRISKHVFTDLDSMQPYMVAARYEHVTIVKDKHALRLLVEAFQKWVVDGPYPYETTRFAKFLHHNGLKPCDDIKPVDYIGYRLPDGRDLRGERITPSTGWFVHNANCVRCSVILQS